MCRIDVYSTDSSRAEYGQVSRRLPNVGHYLADMNAVEVDRRFRPVAVTAVSLLYPYA